MSLSNVSVMAAVMCVCLGAAGLAQRTRQDPSLQQWGVHDEARPMPPVVDPGPAGPPAPVPADAVVLFGGTDLSGWTTTKGAPATVAGARRLHGGREGERRHQDDAGVRRLPASRRVGIAGAGRRQRARTAATAASS